MAKPKTPILVWRQRILASLGLILVSAASAVAVGHVLKNVSYRLDVNTRKTGLIFELEGRHDDVVYLGDSTTLDGVNPQTIEQTTGLRGYNLATGGQSFLASQMVLRQYLAKNAKPQLVVLGLFINAERRESTMSLPMHDALSPTEREYYEREFERVEGRPYRQTIWVHFDAYRYRSALELQIKRWLSPTPEEPVFIEGHLAATTTRVPARPANHEAGLNLAALRSLLVYCQQQGLPVVLFEPPSSPGDLEATTGREAVLRAVESVLADDLARAFYSFNDTKSLPYTLEHWRGTNHLNAKGAELFSRVQLAPMVQQHHASPR